MGKQTPEQPAAPDPVATAKAQSEYNVQAAIAQANLDRINQYTPQGSIVYNQIGTNADGTPQYSQTQTYSPEQQKLYDQNNQIAQALGGLATQQIGRVAATTGTPMNFDKDVALKTSVANPGVSKFTGNTPTMQTSLGNNGQVQTNIGDGGQIQRGVGPNDFSADAQRVAGSVFGQAASRLDPQFTQAANDMSARLANQGIPVGSEAWQREMDNFNRSKNDAYNQANFSAIQAGGAEQSRLFGLDMSKGQFANQAQAQGFAQGQAQGQFANAAQDQRFNQSLGEGEFANNANNMGLQERLAALGFNNSANAQDFNQNLQGAQFTDAARQQQIQEQTYLRNLPLNDIAALLGTGGGVQQPTFNPFAQVGVAAPDYMGQVNNTFNAKMNQYNQAQANNAQVMGSIFGSIGSVGAAAAMSDRRLKHNIVRVGELANGIATYVFSYLGEKVRQFGVMAQEVLNVRPDAVLITPSGYMAVDYGKVW